jgi:hypothetical protein
MPSSTNAYSVTTALIVAFALFVVFIRLKNWIHSSIPIIFYIVLIAYMLKIEGSVPFWLMCTGLGLGLLLRFEFMNERFIRLVKFLELGVLGVIIYLTVQMILAA